MLQCHVGLRRLEGVGPNGSRIQYIAYALALRVAFCALVRFFVATSTCGDNVPRALSHFSD